MERLKQEWVGIDGGKLAKNGVSMIPTDPDKLAELIFLQQDYKDRKSRDAQMFDPNLNAVRI